jgi:hypothetical protein
MAPEPVMPQWLTCFLRLGAPLYGAIKPNGMEPGRHGRDIHAESVERAGRRLEIIGHNNALGTHEHQRLAVSI